MIRIAVSGYCIRNPNDATGWAFVTQKGIWSSGGLVRANTQVGELMSVLMLLKTYPCDETMQIYSNSSYLIGACSLWKRSWQRNNYLREDGSKRPYHQFLIPIHHLIDKSSYPIEFIKTPDHIDKDKHRLLYVAHEKAVHASMQAKKKGVEVTFGNI